MKRLNDRIWEHIKWAGLVASKGEMNTKFLSETLQGIDHFGDGGVCKRTLHLEETGRESAGSIYLAPDNDQWRATEYGN